MGDQTATCAAVTPLIWIGHRIAGGRTWHRCGQQYIRDHPKNEWINERAACFTMALEGDRPECEHQWRYFMLYVASLRVLGEL